MKARFLLFSLFLSIIGCSVSNAQTNATIDFMDIQGSQLKQTFGRNKIVRVKITDINRFVYNVTEEKTEVDFNTAVPSILSSMTLPSFFTLEAPAADSPLTNKAVTTDGQTAAQLKDDLEEKSNDLIRTYRALNKAIDIHNAVVHLSKDCVHRFPYIEGQVKSTLHSFLGGAVTDPIPNFADKMEALLSGKIELASNIIQDMERLSSAWKAQALNEYRKQAIVRDDKAAQLSSELNALKERLKTAGSRQRPGLQIQLVSKEKEVRDHARATKESEEDFKAMNENNTAAVEKAKAILAEINKLKEEGKFYVLVDNIRKVNESNYTYYSETVSMKKDEYRFKITAVAEGQLPCNRPNQQKIEAVIRTKGGVKLDFSTGLFAMMGSEKFLGRSYYYKPVDATQTSIAVADQGERILLGIGALMHIYRRSPSHFKMGGAIGASTTTDFDGMNFHLGPSFIVGDKERFCITLGIVAREVEVLDARYTLEYPYLKDELPDAIPTYKLFPKFGGFASFTYNISSFGK